MMAPKTNNVKLLIQIDENGMPFIKQSERLHFRDALSFIHNYNMPKINDFDVPNTQVQIVLEYIDKKVLKILDKYILRSDEIQKELETFQKKLSEGTK